MDDVFRLMKRTLPQPAPGVKVLKAAELEALVRASSIIAEAEKRAEEIRLQAEEAYRRRREEGYADGVEAGRLEHAEKMMETALAAVEFIERVEDTVVSVVTQAVRKIVGDLDEETRIRQIVSTALAHVRGEERVTVRVAPQDEPAVSKALAAMTSSAFLQVVADPRLKRDSCILESDMGVIDASLDTQLKALERAFASKIRQQ